MSDTVSYDENIEVQQETHFSSGAGGEDNGGYGGGGGDYVGGGDTVSMSSIGSSYNHYNHHYNRRTGGGGRHYYGGSSSPETLNPLCMRIIYLFSAMVILFALFIIIRGVFDFESTPPPKARLRSPRSKTWSGDFSGVYLAKDGGAYASDSATTNPTDTVLCRELALLETRLTITKVSGSDNGTTATPFTFTVVKEPLRNRYSANPRRFNFTSGVRFLQSSSTLGLLHKWKYTDLDSMWVEVSTTITVETNADGGKKGFWEEVQHSTPEVKIKRIFFDEEMTAIFQTKTEHYNVRNNMDIYVIKYSRQK